MVLSFCIRILMQVSFAQDERLKLVEAVVQKETKGGKKDLNDVNSMNMLCSNFLDGHVVLDVDSEFKEGSDVVFEITSEHVNNLSIVLNSQTTNDVKVAETSQTLIDLQDLVY